MTLKRLATPLSLLLAVSPLACGPEPSDSNTDASTSTTDGTSTTDPTGTTSTSTTEPATGTSPSDPPDEPACTPGPVDGELECDPPGEAYAYYEVTMPGVTMASYDEVCDLDAVDDGGPAQTLTLTCSKGQATVVLFTSDPHIPLDLAMGAKLRIQYATQQDGEAEASTLMLRDEADVLLAAGVHGPFLPVTLDPLAIRLRSTDCASTGGDCFTVQRAGVEVTQGDASVTVFDRNVGTLGEFQVVVAASTRQVCQGFGDDCAFSYSPFSTSTLILRAPGG